MQTTDKNDSEGRLRTPPSPQAPPRHWRQAELLIAALLTTDTQHVLLSLSPTTPYDLVVDADGRLFKVQVKWAQFIRARVRAAGRGDRDHYMVNLYAKRRRIRQMTYTAHAFDILAVVCTPTLVYYLPMARLCNTGGRPPRTIRIKPEELLDNTRKDSAAAAERWAPYKNDVRAAIEEMRHSRAAGP